MTIAPSLLCLSLLLGTEPRAAEKPSAPVTFKVASVQARSSKDRDLKGNLAFLCDALVRCSKQDVRVAVFPECALTGYDESAIQAITEKQLLEAEAVIAEACRQNRIAAVVGSPFRSGKHLYNSATVFGTDGTIIERYHKVQLAEGWPTPGDHLSVFPIDGVPCSIIICHDERYPELVRLPVLAGSRVVFYLSHESGLAEERKIGPYRSQIQARAVENSVFVVHANAPANADLSGSHGQSRIIAPDGNLIGNEASTFDEEILVADLELRRATARNATNSLNRGPLTGWWKDGLSQVRILDAQGGRKSGGH